ncbi:MAG: SLATT domain-containing protein [Pseudomonadota bacterium]
MRDPWLQTLSEDLASAVQTPDRPRRRVGDPHPSAATRNRTQVRSTVSAQPTDANADDLKRARDELLKTLTLMKRARFNAWKRLRDKHDAGQIVFALSGIYGFLIPIFTLQFQGLLGTFTANLFGFIAAVATGLSFVVAFLYQQQNYQKRAEQFHDCGLALNRLRYRVRTDPSPSREALLDYHDDYHRILADSENHGDIDYERAILGRPQIAADRRRANVLSLRLMVQTYWACTFVLVTPIAVGTAIWVGMGR